MSNNAWDEMKRAKEDEYFDRLNRQAVDRLRERPSGPRKSPITGEPMREETLMGVVIDRCPTSGGVWLDKGELEQILKGHDEAGAQTWAYRFFKGLFSK